MGFSERRHWNELNWTYVCMSQNNVMEGTNWKAASLAGSVENPTVSSSPAPSARPHASTLKSADLILLYGVIRQLSLCWDQKFLARWEVPALLRRLSQITQKLTQANCYVDENLKADGLGGRLQWSSLHNQTTRQNTAMRTGSQGMSKG